MLGRVAGLSESVVESPLRPAQLRGGARGDHDEAAGDARRDGVQQRELGPEPEEQEDRRGALAQALQQLDVPREAKTLVSS